MGLTPSDNEDEGEESGWRRNRRREDPNGEEGATEWGREDQNQSRGGGFVFGQQKAVRHRPTSLELSFLEPSSPEEVIDRVSCSQQMDTHLQGGI